MADRFGPIANTAQRLVERNGRAVTLVRFDQDPGDASEPWKGPVDITQGRDTADVTACFVGPSDLGYEVESSEMLKRAEQVALVAPGADETRDLTAFNIIEDNGTRWRLTGVQLLRPATTRILYIMGVRR